MEIGDGVLVQYLMSFEIQLLTQTWFSSKAPFAFSHTLPQKLKTRRASNGFSTLKFRHKTKPTPYNHLSHPEVTSEQCLNCEVSHTELIIPGQLGQLV